MQVTHRQPVSDAAAAAMGQSCGNGWPYASPPVFEQWGYDTVVLLEVAPEKYLVMGVGCDAINAMLHALVRINEVKLGTRKKLWLDRDELSKELDLAACGITFEEPSLASPPS